MRNWTAFLLAAALLVVAPPLAFAPTAVEYAFGAGPVGLGLNQTARIGLILPAVPHATVRLMVLNRGDVLFHRDVPVEVTKSGFFYLSFDVAVDDRDFHITDGTSNTVVGRFDDRAAEVSILIGLLVPAVQKLPESANHMTASLQLLLGDGSVILALPFIEQRLTR